MAPGMGGALDVKYVSCGLLCGGRQHVQELELDVAGGRLGKPTMEERHDGMAFGVSENSGDGSTPSRNSQPECCKRRGEKSIEVLKAEVINELSQYCGRIDPSPKDLISWPISVANRWKNLNGRKPSEELGILSWNTNGRLDFRGCRESLLKRWALKGFVDVGLIQEHFIKGGVPLYDLFGPAWWNISSGAVGESRGRRSGGCAVFGQPGLVRDRGF